MPLSLGVICKKCKYRGHQTSDCDKHCKWCQNILGLGHYDACARAPTCQQCEQKGHTDYSCQEKKRKTQDSQVKSEKATRCFHCGGLGHIKWNCFQKEPTCFECGEEGHQKKDCTGAIPIYPRCDREDPLEGQCSTNEKVYPKPRMPDLQSIVLQLVGKLYRGEFENRLIQHIPYRAVIEAVGGEEIFTRIALDAIDPLVIALQNQPITLDRLNAIQLSQSREKKPWPSEPGGYCDYITDDRDDEYCRIYVGQGSILRYRITGHKTAIRNGKCDSLHYYIICNRSAASHRQANFLRLWVLKLPGATDSFIRDAFENVMEMTFVRVFQTLPPQILEEYFGPCPEGSYSNVGLNIVPPLMQGRELASTIRGQMTKLLELSRDPEISGWPKIRAEQKILTQKEEFLKSDVKGRQLSSQQNLEALRSAIMQNPNHKDSLAWGPGHEIPWAGHAIHQDPVDIQAWFQCLSSQALDNGGCSSGDLVCPVGTVEASVGLVIDSSPCHDYGQGVILPWGLKESGFTEENLLIWIVNCQMYKIDPDTLSIRPPRPADLTFLLEKTRSLIQGSNMKVIVLCGAMTEQVVLADRQDTDSLTLNLQGLDFKVWIDRRGQAIKHIFIRSPALLVKLWTNKGPLAQKIAVLFRFVAAITNLKLHPSFYQSVITVALLVRGWSGEKNQELQPLEPDFDGIDPSLVIWLKKHGFTENGDIRRLADCTGGSLRLGMLALNHALPRNPRDPSFSLRCIPQSKIVRRGIISPEFMSNVRTLLDEMKTKNTQLMALAQGESVAVEVAEEEHLLGEGDIDELCEAINCGSSTEEPPLTVDEKDIPLVAVCFMESKPYKMTFRKQCQLLNGSFYKGSEFKQGSYSNYQFNIQHTTFRVDHAPPCQENFFIKTEIAPEGEQHPNKYAEYAAQGDPAIRLAIRVSLRDENGEELFSQYPTSSSWQATAIANSLFDQLAGHELEDICLRRVRYVFIDKRLSNVPQVLEPFRNGAYRDDDGHVVTFKGRRKTYVT